MNKQMPARRGWERSEHIDIPCSVRDVRATATIGVVGWLNNINKMRHSSTCLSIWRNPDHSIESGKLLEIDVRKYAI